MSIISEIKQKTDIVDIVGQHTKLTKAGKTYRGLCPFHSEKHGSFFVYPEQQSWHCFGACNTGGDVFSFIMKKQGVTFSEALQTLADRARVVIPTRFEREPDKDEKERLYGINKAAAGYYHALLMQSREGERAKKYLTGRGFSPDSLVKFELGYSTGERESLKKYLSTHGYSDIEMLVAGLIIKADDGTTHDRFRNRIMFPIHDARGRTTGFGGRAMDDAQQPKYLNSPQTPVFDKGGTLYAFDFAAETVRKEDLLVIVEGYADVIIAHQFGFANVVASMGTAIGENHINIFKRLTKNMVLALDPDAAGQEAMLRGISYENTLVSQVKVIILPEGKDPDEVIKEAPETWRHLVSQAVPVMDFMFSRVTTGLDLTGVAGKTAVVEKLLPFIAAMENDVARNHYLNKLATLTRTNYHNIELALGKIKLEHKATVVKSVPEGISKLTTVTDPIEEYCLALLIQHYDLKDKTAKVSPELFEGSENREIFRLWQEVDNVESLKEKLDDTIREHFNILREKKVVESRLEQKLDELVLRLQEKYIRNLERQKELVLGTVAETGGSAAELAELEQHGLNNCIDLVKVFAQRNRGKRIAGGRQ